MTDISDDTLKQVKLAGAQAWSKDQKIAFLHEHGWRRVVGNRWQARNGIVAAFGAAVTAQLLADMERE